MKNKIKLFLLAGLLALLVVFSTTDASAQCAMCRATVESNNTHRDNEVGRGLNTGILYLMVIPYILVGSIGLIWYRYSRKNKNAEAH